MLAKVKEVTVESQLSARALDKKNLGSGFSKDMSREQLKSALISARAKAKEFHNIL